MNRNPQYTLVSTKSAPVSFGKRTNVHCEPNPKTTTYPPENLPEGHQGKGMFHQKTLAKATYNFLLELLLRMNYMCITLKFRMGQNIGSYNYYCDGSQ